VSARHGFAPLWISPGYERQVSPIPVSMQRAKREFSPDRVSAGCGGTCTEICAAALPGAPQPATSLAPKIQSPASASAARFANFRPSMCHPEKNSLKARYLRL